MRIYIYIYLFVFHVHTEFVAPGAPSAERAPEPASQGRGSRELRSEEDPGKCWGSICIYIYIYNMYIYMYAMKLSM